MSHTHTQVAEQTLKMFDNLNPDRHVETSACTKVCLCVCVCITIIHFKYVFTVLMFWRNTRTRMKRYTQIIYMLSQSKDTIDNPAALFARITQCELGI